MTVSYPTAISATRAPTHGVTATTDAARQLAPILIARDELFFWTRKWQEGEAESAAARASGDFREFSSGRDAVRWLLSDDD